MKDPPLYWYRVSQTYDRKERSYISCSQVFRPYRCKSKTESKTNRQFYLAKSDTVIKEENIPKNKLLLTG